MKRNAVLSLLGSCALAIVGSGAMAQERLGWGYQVEGLAMYQSNTDLDDGGDFSQTRALVRGSARYNAGEGNSIGLSVSVGEFDYDFDDVAAEPWNNVRDIRVSIPISYRLNDRARVFLSPGARWDYETDASASDGDTYGVFAGIAWKFSDSLTIGPAFGAYSQLEDSGADIFPALLVDWDINERWNLNTGTGLGATGGPGLTLGYSISEASTISLTGRRESVQFRLDDDGPAPDGVGEDRSYPVVIAYTYRPNPGMAFNVFAGAEFGGRLKLEDSSGSTVSKQDYDTAPVFGAAFQLRF